LALVRGNRLTGVSEADPDRLGARPPEAEERIVGVAADILARKDVEVDLTEARLRRAQELGGAIPFE